MRPVCSASSRTDSRSSSGSPSTTPASMPATSSASCARRSSSRATARTVCTSARATSRASPLSSVVIPHQGTELVLEPARLDRAVDAALLRRVRLPPPAAGAEVFAGLRRARARRAADRGVALVVQRVVGQLVLEDVLLHLVLGPFGDRVELHDRAVVVVDLHLAD